MQLLTHQVIINWYLLSILGQKVTVTLYRHRYLLRRYINWLKNL